MSAALGFPVGLLLGFVIHRGDFCMHSALRETLRGRPDSSTRVWLTALALQVAAVNALAGLGWLEVPIPPVTVVAASVGGLVFGAGMVMGKG